MPPCSVLLLKMNCSGLSGGKVEYTYTLWHDSMGHEVLWWWWVAVAAVAVADSFSLLLQFTQWSCWEMMSSRRPRHSPGNKPHTCDYPGCHLSFYRVSEKNRHYRLKHTSWSLTLWLSLWKGESGYDIEDYSNNACTCIVLVISKWSLFCVWCNHNCKTLPDIHCPSCRVSRCLLSVKIDCPRNENLYFTHRILK